MRLVLFFSSLFLVNTAFAGYEIYRSQDGQKVDISVLQAQMGLPNQIMVLGEWHYQESIQQAQADIIQKTSQTRPQIAWEFLNLEDRVDVEAAGDRVRSGQSTSKEFLDQFFPPGSSYSYKPIIDLIYSERAEIMATNLSREQKRPVTRNGLGAIDPNLIPPDFELGGDLYFERFEEAMGGHTHGFDINNLYASQCLTDDVIAYSLSKADLRLATYLVIGSFHSDYFLGTVERLNDRLPTTEIFNLRFITRDELNSSSVQEWLSDDRYGVIADYLIVAE